MNDRAELIKIIKELEASSCKACRYSAHRLRDWLKQQTI